MNRLERVTFADSENRGSFDICWKTASELRYSIY